MLTHGTISLCLQGVAAVLQESLETFRAVIQVFVDAYNRFGYAKYRYRQHQNKGGLPFALVDFF